MKTRVYGIDLGTTNSAIAFVNDDGRPEIIPNSDNERITPSVVYFDEPRSEGEPGGVVVGKVAKESARIDPAREISFVKQEMGTGWTKELNGITLTPEKVSAFILRRLISDAEISGHFVRDVIITCPAYFGDAERKATLAAGEIAGLNVVRVIDEPVAAAMHYGLNKLPSDSTAVVYDLGGGTFDVTVVSIEGGVVRIVCTDGNHRLGGKNWDERLVEYLADRFAEATGADKDALLNDPESCQELQLMAEFAKQTLSVRNSARVKVSLNGCSERIEITRDIFNEITKDLLNQTIELTEKIIDLAAARYDLRQIDNFVLVGGSTRMPQVLAAIKENFGARVKNEPQSFEVDEAVAKGAALFGMRYSFQDRLTGTPGSIPSASRSYGVRLATDESQTLDNMLIKGELLPLDCEREFAMPAAGSDKMAFQVFANELSEKYVPSIACEEVGEIMVKLPHRRSANMKVRVRLSLSGDKNLSMNISYITITSGIPARVEFFAEKEPVMDDGDGAQPHAYDVLYDDLVIE